MKTPRSGRILPQRGPVRLSSSLLLAWIRRNCPTPTTVIDDLACSASGAMLDPFETHRRDAMRAAQNRPGSASDREESLDAQVPPIPDEDGPHDVPDEKVIEKTLPTHPAPGAGGGKGPPKGR